MEWQNWMTYAAGGLMLTIILSIVILYIKAASQITCPRCYGTGEKSLNGENMQCDWCGGKGHMTKKQLIKIQESAIHDLEPHNEIQNNEPEAQVEHKHAELKHAEHKQGGTKQPDKKQA